MIRVTHVLWEARFGGIEKLTYDLAVQQSQDPDLRVRILFGHAVGDLLPMFERAGLEIQDAGLTGGFDLSPQRVIRAQKFMAQADVLHLHTFVTPLAFAAWRSHRPVVYTEHGNFGFGRSRTIRDRLKAPLHRAFLRRGVSHLTFNSDFTRRIWEERHGSLPLTRSVVNNGIALEALGVTPNGDTAGLKSALGDAFVVGTSCRFAGFKRVDRLIRAFAQFAPGKNTRLLLVGDGVLRSELVALVKELGIADQTIFTGFRQDVRAVQDLMDVCVFPSQNEPFGLVAVETLSLGKPTLVFADGGGIADIIRPVCQADVVRDEDRLADRLSYYYDHVEELDPFITPRIQHASKYDVRTMAGSYKQIYLSLVKTSDRCRQPELAPVS